LSSGSIIKGVKGIEMKKKIIKKETKLQELERRIKDLENNRLIFVQNPNPPIVFPPPLYDQNLHYHNGQPCRNNPCIWC